MLLRPSILTSRHRSVAFGAQVMCLMVHSNLNPGTPGRPSKRESLLAVARHPKQLSLSAAMFQPQGHGVAQAASSPWSPSCGAQPMMVPNGMPGAHAGVPLAMPCCGAQPMMPNSTPAQAPVGAWNSGQPMMMVAPNVLAQPSTPGMQNGVPNWMQYMIMQQGVGGLPTQAMQPVTAAAHAGGMQQAQHPPGVQEQNGESAGAPTTSTRIGSFKDNQDKLPPNYRWWGAAFKRNTRIVLTRRLKVSCLIAWNRQMFSLHNLSTASDDHVDELTFIVGGFRVDTQMKTLELCTRGDLRVCFYENADALHARQPTRMEQLAHDFSNSTRVAYNLGMHRDDFHPSRFATLGHVTEANTHGLPSIMPPPMSGPSAGALRVHPPHGLTPVRAATPKETFAVAQLPALMPPHPEAGAMAAPGASGGTRLQQHVEVGSTCLQQPSPQARAGNSAHQEAIPLFPASDESNDEDDEKDVADIASEHEEDVGPVRNAIALAGETDSQTNAEQEQDAANNDGQSQIKKGKRRYRQEMPMGLSHEELQLLAKMATKRQRTQPAQAEA